MPPHAVKLLHVEDDVAQRLLVGKYLALLKEFAFTVVRASAEPTAVTEFGKGGFDLVLLDYHLSFGNGLSCLQRLRQLDAGVPIVALSGVAPPEIIEQLRQHGADDFLNKDDLTPETFARCLRRALGRSHLRTAVVQVAQTAVTGVAPELYRQLDELEAAVRQAGLNADQVRRLFESVQDELEAARSPEHPPAQRLVRPLLGDLLVGLFGDLLDRDAKPGARKPGP